MKRYILCMVLGIILINSALAAYYNFSSKYDLFESNTVLSRNYSYMEVTRDYLNLSNVAKKSGFKFLYVANERTSDVSKIDTEKNIVVAIYKTGDFPNSKSQYPSRVVVDKNGDAWVANTYGQKKVVKITSDPKRCTDQNHDGVIETSSGSALDYGWDECVTIYRYWQYGDPKDGSVLPDGDYNYPENGPVGIAVDVDGNVWAGMAENDKMLYKLNSNGQLLTNFSHSSSSVNWPFGYTMGYNNVLWMIHQNDGICNLNTKTATNTNSISCPYNYNFLNCNPSLVTVGTCVFSLVMDRSNNIYFTNWHRGKISKINSAGQISTIFQFSKDYYQSLANLIISQKDDSLWVINYKIINSDPGVYPSSTLYKLNKNGNVLCSIALDYEDYYTGLAEDAQYNLWVVGREKGLAHKIDSNCNYITNVSIGLGSYVYGDITGNELVQLIKTGNWKVTIGNNNDLYNWTNVSWRMKNVGNGGLVNLTINIPGKPTKEYLYQGSAAEAGKVKDFTITFGEKALNMSIEFTLYKDESDTSPIISSIIADYIVDEVTRQTICNLSSFNGQLPINAEWNDQGKNGYFTQTKISNVWDPLDKSASYDQSPGECHFKCNAGKIWDATNMRCTDPVNTQLANCGLNSFGGKLPENASWNDIGNGDKFVQTKSGNTWSPAEIAASYDQSPGECHFKCNVGKIWNESLQLCTGCLTCTREVAVLGFFNIIELLTALIGIGVIYSFLKVKKVIS